MNKVLTHLSLAAAISGAMMSADVMAYEAGDWVVRAGATTVEPDEDGRPITLNGAPLEAVDPALGGELGVDSNTQLGLTIEYMLGNNLGIELLLATPFEHTASAIGNLSGVMNTVAGGNDLADIKHLPPTLMAIYHFNHGGRLQPYVGWGLNYTTFFDEELTSEADATFAALELTGGDVELEDSWGLSVQVGFDYHLNDKWLVNGSVRWIDIDTEAEITFDDGSQVNADLEIDPYVYTLSVGYKF